MENNGVFSSLLHTNMRGLLLLLSLYFMKQWISAWLLSTWLSLSWLPEHWDEARMWAFLWSVLLQIKRCYNVETGKVVSRHHVPPGTEGIHLLPLTQQSSLIHTSHQTAVVSQAGRCLGAGEAVEFEKKISLRNCNYPSHNFAGSRIQQRPCIILLLLTPHF